MEESSNLEEMLKVLNQNKAQFNSEKHYKLFLNVLLKKLHKNCQYTYLRNNRNNLKKLPFCKIKFLLRLFFQLKSSYGLYKFLQFAHLNTQHFYSFYLLLLPD